MSSSSTLLRCRIRLTGLLTVDSMVDKHSTGDDNDDEDADGDDGADDGLDVDGFQSTSC